MAFVRVINDDYELFFPEHGIFWMTIRKSVDVADGQCYETTICHKTVDGFAMEETYRGLPSFRPSGK